MKTIKAKTLEELRQKVYQTEWYSKCLKHKEDIEQKIEVLKKENEYVERDLYEELFGIKRALNISYASSEIIKGYMNNRPYLGSYGGHSRMTLIKLYHDKQRTNYNTSFFIFDATIYPAWSMPDLVE